MYDKLCSGAAADISTVRTARRATGRRRRKVYGNNLFFVFATDGKRTCVKPHVTAGHCRALGENDNHIFLDRG